VHIPKTKVLVVLVSGAFIISATLSMMLGYYPFSQFNTLGQQSESHENSKTIGGHSPGYPLVKSTGEILDPISNVLPKDGIIDASKYLREFNYGKVSKFPNGTILREFTIVASDDEVKEISPGIFFNVWTFNGTIPGPTIRATEGDMVKINFINNGSKPHSIHTHGIHPANMDGVFEMIPSKGKYTYEFVAQPYGVFPYHCHMTPLEEHINHGLYGVYIVDPKIPRAPADEMVMVMNGYDTDFDAENNFYTVNGIPFYYFNKPIQIEKDKPARIYLVNMLEFDQINNFHIHANLFNYYSSGTRQEPDQYTDIVTLSQGDRGILEFNYTYPGSYMFHAHKTEFSEKGWMGLFDVMEGKEINDGNDALKNKTHGNIHPFAKGINDVDYIKNRYNSIVTQPDAASIVSQTSIKLNDVAYQQNQRDSLHSQKHNPELLLTLPSFSLSSSQHQSASKGGGGFL
jgi:hypothetical protein